ncbi:MFS transporter [Nocardioides sp.]|uniref:MFS transporter n=1 Tax=Nocardioides sp. TaxID=35761 RepID=UPI003516DDBB
MPTPDLQAPPLTEDERAVLHARVLRVVVACQIFGGAGLAAGVTVGGLLAADLLDSDAAAGLPAALFTLGSAIAAFTVGRVSQARGRRIGLGGGFLVGAVGAVAIVVAAVTESVPLLFVGLVVYGTGTATNLQARYAGTDLALPHQRGTAISTALVATTLGAVAGPNLVGPLGRLAEAVGVPSLAGPFLLAAAAYAAAGAVLLVRLRPDPLLTARRWTPPAETPGDDDARPTLPPVAHGVAVGTTTMVLTQIAMVAIMTMTPVHMRDHGHGLGEIGFVIGAHIAAMYLPSLVTGPLVDRVGRVPMALSAAATLVAAGVVAALAPPTSMVQLTLALVLLGLGWNLGLISGTTLVVDATAPQERARVQGGVDVLIALSGAGAGALSGVVVGAGSYALLSLVGGLLALVLVPVVALARANAPVTA